MSEENITPTEKTTVAPEEPAAQKPADYLGGESDAADASKPDKTSEDEGCEETRRLLDRISALEAELMKEQIKVRLLTLGILPEKLEDGAAMAYGLYLAGKTPDDAAEEIITAYPHLKAVRRELPQFAAESTGSGDGFSAIRRIFSAR